MDYVYHTHEKGLKAVEKHTRLVSAADLSDSRFDALVVVSFAFDQANLPQAIFAAFENAKKTDASIGSEVSCTNAAVPGGRLIFSPTGPIDRDHDDARRYYEAGQAGLKRAAKAGSKRPLFLIILPKQAAKSCAEEMLPDFSHAAEVALLGALFACYVPLEVREALDASTNFGLKIEEIGVVGCPESQVQVINAIEAGRILGRDIGGGDPERMASKLAALHIQGVLQSESNVRVKLISDHATLLKEYPLLEAVARASVPTERHQPCVISLEYDGGEPEEKSQALTTLLLVGKGITYDTGGADVKTGGSMVGMHRDKCGAAAIAGFFKTLAILKPKGLKVLARLAMVRNSIGSNAYVADEIIRSRAGVRVRIGNTDAEGRMVMADLLAEMKELAPKEKNPRLFTIATLTGHAIRAYGLGYTAICPNGPARQIKLHTQLANTGHAWADPFEVSTIRRDDYEFVAPKTICEDVVQANNQPSTLTSRGHQFPAAFLIIAAGLDKHGSNSASPLPYVHLDIAGSAALYPSLPTSSPIVALTANFVVPLLKQ